MNNALQAVLDTFSGVSDWLVGGINDIAALFYNSTDNTLTIFGVMAIAGVGIATALLLINVVKSFIRMK